MGKTDRLWLTLICLAYLFFALRFGAINPLFEAPDEHHHYFAAEVIATTGNLPSVDDPYPRQEAAQPPLYYLIAAAVIAPLQLDPQEARESLWFNPYVRLGDPTSKHNINAFVHDQSEDYPWRGYVLAAHLLRILSTLLGLGTLIFIFKSMRLIFPQSSQPALIGTALVALLPQFLFVHSAISNDPLITLLATAGLYQLLWFIPRAGSTGLIRKTRLSALGVTIGAAMLTKNQGVLLLVLAGGLFFYFSLREKGWRWLWRFGVFVAVPALLMVLPLWWRNWNLYGDITATNQFIELAGGDRNFSLAQVWGERRLLWTSLIAAFGWQNVNPSVWVYRGWVGMGGVAVVGVAKTVFGIRYSVFSIRSVQAFVLLVAWMVLVLGALVGFMMQTSAAQGRLLFPGLLPLAVVVGGGIAAWRNQKLTVVVIVLAVGMARYSQFVIEFAYALPSTRSAETYPQIPEELDLPEWVGRVAQFDELTLHSAYAFPHVAYPNDTVKLNLSWEAVTIPEDAPVVDVELIGRNHTVVGSARGYHGRGQYPATLWELDTIVSDEMFIRLANDMQVPTLVRPFVKLVGDENAVPMSEFKVVPAQWPDLAFNFLAMIEPGIGIASATIDPPVAQRGNTITITIVWRTTRPVLDDYTTFVQLLNAEQNTVLASGDSPPLNGDYPTRVWNHGEQFADTYSIIIPSDLPTGTYPINIGLYSPESGIRQPLFVDDERHPHDSLTIGTVTIGD